MDLVGNQQQTALQALMRCASIVVVLFACLIASTL
jgi:hypothetical protein